MSDWNKSVIAEYRSGNEEIAGGRFSRSTLLLLHTKGAKSGEERINPVAFTRDGDRYIIIASKGGSDSNPDWYYNLVANPEVSVEVGSEQFAATASVPGDPEYTRLYDQMAAVMPGFADYKLKTSRTIPVVVLTRK